MGSSREPAAVGDSVSVYSTIWPRVTEGGQKPKPKKVCTFYRLRPWAEHGDRAIKKQKKQARLAFHIQVCCHLRSIGPKLDTGPKPCVANIQTLLPNSQKPEPIKSLVPEFPRWPEELRTLLQPLFKKKWLPRVSYCPEMVLY